MTCFLFASDPPRIDRMPAILYVPEGDNAKLKVFYGGDQPMEVSLSKDDKDIPASDDVRYTVFDDYVIILMKEVRKRDEGIYTLKLTNPSGSVSGTFTINVTGNYEYSKNSSEILCSLFIARVLTKNAELCNRITWSANWSTGCIRNNETYVRFELASAAIRWRIENHSLRR